MESVSNEIDQIRESTLTRIDPKSRLRHKPTTCLCGGATPTKCEKCPTGLVCHGCVDEHEALFCFTPAHCSEVVDEIAHSEHSIKGKESDGAVIPIPIRKEILADFEVIMEIVKDFTNRITSLFPAEKQTQVHKSTPALDAFLERIQCVCAATANTTNLSDFVANISDLDATFQGAITNPEIIKLVDTIVLQELRTQVDTIKNKIFLIITKAKRSIDQHPRIDDDGDDDIDVDDGGKEQQQQQQQEEKSYWTFSGCITWVKQTTFDALNAVYAGISWFAATLRDVFWDLANQGLTFVTNILPLIVADAKLIASSAWPVLTPAIAEVVSVSTGFISALDSLGLMCVHPTAFLPSGVLKFLDTIKAYLKRFGENVSILLQNIAKLAREYGHIFMTHLREIFTWITPTSAPSESECRDNMEHSINEAEQTGLMAWLCRTATRIYNSTTDVITHWCEVVAGVFSKIHTIAEDLIGRIFGVISGVLVKGFGSVTKLLGINIKAFDPLIDNAAMLPFDATNQHPIIMADTPALKTILAANPTTRPESITTFVHLYQTPTENTNRIILDAFRDLEPSAPQYADLLEAISLIEATEARLFRTLLDQLTPQTVWDQVTESFACSHDLTKMWMQSTLSHQDPSGPTDMSFVHAARMIANAIPILTTPLDPQRLATFTVQMHKLTPATIYIIVKTQMPDDLSLFTMWFDAISKANNVVKAIHIPSVRGLADYALAPVIFENILGAIASVVWDMNGAFPRLFGTLLISSVTLSFVRAYCLIYVIKSTYTTILDSAPGSRRSAEHEDEYRRKIATETLSTFGVTGNSLEQMGTRVAYKWVGQIRLDDPLPSSNLAASAAAAISQSFQWIIDFLFGQISVPVSTLIRFAFHVGHELFTKRRQSSFLDVMGMALSHTFVDVLAHTFVFPLIFPLFCTPTFIDSQLAQFSTGAILLSVGPVLRFLRQHNQGNNGGGRRTDDDDDDDDGDDEITTRHTPRHSTRVSTGADEPELQLTSRSSTQALGNSRPKMRRPTPAPIKPQADIWDDGGGDDDNFPRASSTTTHGPHGLFDTLVIKPSSGQERSQLPMSAPIVMIQPTWTETLWPSVAATFGVIGTYTQRFIRMPIWNIPGALLPASDYTPNRPQCLPKNPQLEPDRMCAWLLDPRDFQILEFHRTAALAGIQYARDQYRSTDESRLLPKQTILDMISGDPSTTRTEAWVRVLRKEIEKKTGVRRGEFDFATVDKTTHLATDQAAVNAGAAALMANLKQELAKERNQYGDNIDAIHNQWEGRIKNIAKNLLGAIKKSIEGTTFVRNYNIPAFTRAFQLCRAKLQPDILTGWECHLARLLDDVRTHKTGESNVAQFWSLLHVLTSHDLQDCGQLDDHPFHKWHFRTITPLLIMTIIPQYASDLATLLGKIKNFASQHGTTEAVILLSYLIRTFIITDTPQMPTMARSPIDRIFWDMTRPKDGHFTEFMQEPIFGSLLLDDTQCIQNAIRFVTMLLYRDQLAINPLVEYARSSQTIAEILDNTMQSIANLYSMFFVVELSLHNKGNPIDLDQSPTSVKKTVRIATTDATKYAREIIQHLRRALTIAYNPRQTSHQDHYLGASTSAAAAAAAAAATTTVGPIDIDGPIQPWYNIETYMLYTLAAKHGSLIKSLIDVCSNYAPEVNPSRGLDEQSIATLVPIVFARVLSHFEFDPIVRFTILPRVGLHSHPLETPDGLQSETTPAVEELQPVIIEKSPSPSLDAIEEWPTGKGEAMENEVVIREDRRHEEEDEKEDDGPSPTDQLSITVFSPIGQTTIEVKENEPDAQLSPRMPEPVVDQFAEENTPPSVPIMAKPPSAPLAPTATTPMPVISIPSSAPSIELPLAPSPTSSIPIAAKPTSAPLAPIATTPVSVNPIPSTAPSIEMLPTTHVPIAAKPTSAPLAPIATTPMPMIPITASPTSAPPTPIATTPMLPLPISRTAPSVEVSPLPSSSPSLLRQQTDTPTKATPVGPLVPQPSPANKAAGTTTEEMEKKRARLLAQLQSSNHR